MPMRTAELTMLRVLRGEYSSAFNVVSCLFNPDQKPCIGTMIAKAEGFFRREIHDNETISPSFLGSIDNPLLAVDKERIVITHENDGDSYSRIPRLLDHVETFRNVCPVGQRNVV